MHEPQAEDTEDTHAAIKKVSAPREQKGLERRQQGWEDRKSRSGVIPISQVMLPVGRSATRRQAMIIMQFFGPLEGSRTK